MNVCFVVLWIVHFVTFNLLCCCSLIVMLAICLSFFCGKKLLGVYYTFGSTTQNWCVKIMIKQAVLKHVQYSVVLFYLFSVIVFVHVIQRRRGLKKLGWAEVAIFWQAAGNFQQRRLWVLKISILPLNVPKREFFFGPKFCIFGPKISDKNNIFRHPKI